MNVYELSEEYSRATEDLNAMLLEGSVDEDTVTATLDGIRLEIEDKLIDIAKDVKNLEASIDAMKKAREQIKQREDFAKIKMEKLKLFIKAVMKDSDLPKIQTPYFDISRRKNPPKIDIRNPEFISEKYIKVEMIEKRSIDKKAILSDLKSNKSVEGAILIQEERVDIK